MQATLSLEFGQASADKLQPSSAYKKQVVKVLFSIIGFFVVYILLMLAAIGLAIGSVYAAGFIIMIKPSFITISIGFGLLALAVSVVVFLIKFIFSSTKNVNQLRVQLKEDDQPELFAFIRKISIETETKFPKKIFISPEVNACVFYNSSFWSMLFPVRKNLEIGVGLVNALNVSEFRAVVAHEFGHFSQRSMKLGSFTYNVNQVVYNMLYNNAGYNKFLNTWGGLGGVASLFAGLTVKIANSIQWLLRGVYKVVNKNYMSLSREMEYHADAVAASVAGGNNLVTALAQIQIADSCYEQVLRSADGWLKEMKVSRNLFSNQHFVLNDSTKQRNISSRINYKDQWASHPGFEDRKIHLERLDMNCPPDESSAWSVFRGPQEIQQQMTAKLYQNVPTEKPEWEECDAQYFEKWYTNEKARFELPAVYKGFYDDRFIDIDKWDLQKLSSEKTELSFDELFTDEHGKLEATIQSCKNDVAILEAIGTKGIAVNSFDFDGAKYKSDETETILAGLQDELKGLQAKQSSLDIAAFQYFFGESGETNGTVMEAYTSFQSQSAEHFEFNTLAQRIFETVVPLYQQGNSMQFVIESIENLTMELEPKLKQLLIEFLNTPFYANALTKEPADRVKAFTGRKHMYYENDQFRNDELEELQFVVDTMGAVLNNSKFEAYKQLLNQQLTVLAVN